MTKSELIKAIAEHGELSRADAEIALLAVQHSITKALAKGERITLPGFGTFKVVETAARTGRNPQTGEPVDIPAKRKVKFTPNEKLKDLVKA
ncbi:DNA-binding protein [Eikenella sp. NML03-A-027]|uniref:HU family DNA-binding protein n=1 Tax=Eikenella sp. NML03-A-027 TaxID=1795828 RepID=UPI0007E132A2|nr:HU family DNA-binding protein [Eikenella sp. NML03-A-027]OAM32314.1 DNA-binding protein [Eikenella sp. NML03-A-027]